MHEKLGKVKKRTSVKENVILVLGILIGLAIVRMMDKSGMPQKWHAAVFGTIVPFGAVIASYQMRWSRWSFWLSVFFCLIIHTCLIWIFFQDTLSNSRHLGLLYWTPIALFEAFALLIAVSKIEEKLTGKKESIKIS
jgi:small basic protein